MANRSDVYRTPDERFDDLSGYDLHYGSIERLADELDLGETTVV